jgi:hypothetical protein
VTARAFEAWSGEWWAQVIRVLLLAAVALLFLDAAATVELVYTIRPSYALLAGASVLGAPFVVRGWLRIPAAVRWAAAAVLGAYVLAALFGDAEVVASDERGGSHRSLVYLADLIVGLAVTGLVVDLAPDLDRLRPLLWALIGSGAVASLYGIYQWFGLHYEWPLTDVNNAATNSENFDLGLLGWQRIRSTFPEPHFLASYLVAVIPVAGTLAVGSGRSARWVAGAAAAMLLATAMAASAPAWCVFALSLTGGLAVFGVARGRVGLAAVSAGGLTLVAVVGVLFVANPAPLAGLTGRSGGALEDSARFRTHAWHEGRLVWATRPVLGFGPGQSSVRLGYAIQQASNPDPSGRQEPPPLRSAHGLWLASLIDAGVIGFAAWTGFFAVLFGLGARALMRMPTWPVLGIFVATLAAVVSREVSGDRLEVRVWVLIGILLAAERVSSAAAAPPSPPASERSARSTRRPPPTR